MIAARECVAANASLLPWALPALPSSPSTRLIPSGRPVPHCIEWVSDGEVEARQYLADHAEPDDASLIATGGSDVICAATVWQSNHAGLRSRGIPLVHQIAVAGPYRRRDVATLRKGDAGDHG
jgi:hypothetical protein